MHWQCCITFNIKGVCSKKESEKNTTINRQSVNVHEFEIQFSKQIPICSIICGWPKWGFGFCSALQWQHPQAGNDAPFLQPGLLDPVSSLGIWHKGFSMPNLGRVWNWNTESLQLKKYYCLICYSWSKQIIVASFRSLPRCNSYLGLGNIYSSNKYSMPMQL